MYPLETVYLDNIDGFGFEDLCARIFERLNWAGFNLLAESKMVEKTLSFTCRKAGA